MDIVGAHWGATRFTGKTGRAPVRSYGVREVSTLLQCRQKPPRRAVEAAVGHEHHVVAVAHQAAQGVDQRVGVRHGRSEEHTSELQSLMRISYAVFCLKKKK